MTNCCAKPAAVVNIQSDLQKSCGSEAGITIYC